MVGPVDHKETASFGAVGENNLAAEDYPCLNSTRWDVTDCKNVPRCDGGVTMTMMK
jgi:hypothetical protein